MGNVVYLDKDGKIHYKGLLTSKEIENIDDILNTLKDEIPIIETELKDLYGDSVLYKYNLGKCLGNLLEDFNIPYYERRAFWDEIKHFATTETRKRDDGKNSTRRSFFEQCYALSQIELSIVKKLSWRQWQSLLDRSIEIDTRLYEWIKNRSEKIREDDWRDFLKALNLYLKNNDTCVFNDNEVFQLYESFIAMGAYWRNSIKQFAKEFPKSAKLQKTSLQKRSKKYKEMCFALKKELRKPLDISIFEQAFEKAMK